MIPYHETRSALHMVVYIRESGAEPLPPTTLDWKQWASGVHKQFDRLQKVRGKKEAKEACLRGRSLIAERGLLAAATESLPPPKPGDRVRCLFCSKWGWPTLESALIALAGLKRAPDIRKPDLLGVYQCPTSPPWHIGHKRCAPWATLCIGEHK